MKLTILLFLALIIGLQSQVFAGDAIFYGGDGISHGNGRTYINDGVGGLRDTRTNEYLRPAGPNGVRDSQNRYHPIVDPWDEREKDMWGDRDRRPKDWD